ncbi:hypothetical protein Ssi02_66630 [Sinosporangium siamense]|uniref:Uncharacterized protein n=1 Tax=Sinosporangium siamense TaxID=1367973 RepID=A0A919RNJ0_9ACTN|nr:hypothetical protein Ssi02_66630 [Sinosporangium siamense]
MDKAAVQRLLSCRNIPLRERALWRMLYETAVRRELTRGDVPKYPRGAWSWFCMLRTPVTGPPVPNIVTSFRILEHC